MIKRTTYNTLNKKIMSMFKSMLSNESDGHRIVEHGVVIFVYCPKVKDNVRGNYTSIGVKCTCGKIIK